MIEKIKPNHEYKYEGQPDQLATEIAPTNWQLADKINELVEAVNRLEQIHDPEFIRKSSIDPGFYKSI